MARDTENRPAISGTHYAMTIDAVEVSGWASSLPERSPPEARIGQVVGSYRLVEIVGSGGMGCVYRAEHVLLGRAVAVKVLHEHHTRRRDAVARLRQEARAASQIRHRNVVDIVDYLEVDDDLVCVVMEYLPGLSLGRLMDRVGRLPAVRALDIVSQMCDGLEAAHAAGIVHRDLKPDNVVVMTGPDGGDLVKVLDFGIAKLDDDEDGPLTAAGQVIGTPPYMSPEQAGAGVVDARADIYSLGAILYELFTGKTPFVAHSFDEYVFKHLAVAPLPPRATGVLDLDPRIESLIMRCLDKDPAARFTGVGELRSEIRAIRESLVRGPRRRRLRIGAGVAAAIALIVFAFAVADDPVSGRPASPEPSPRAAPDLGPEMVRIVSQPPGLVYRQEGGRALCETPCAIAVASQRDRTARPSFLVRRRGYREQAISVDPEAPPTQVSVRLERDAR